MKLVKFWIFLTMLLLIQLGFAQEKNTALEKKLDELAQTKKSLNQTIKADISGLTLADFIASIAQDHQLNLNAEPELNQIISGTFYDISVKEVLLYLTQKYNLDVEFFNNIITFKKKKDIVVPIKKPIKNINVDYNKENDFLTLKLENDTLSSVIQRIVDKTNKNVIISQDIKSNLISSYILNRPFEQAMSLMAKSNNLNFIKDESGYYSLEKSAPAQIATTEKEKGKASKTTSPESVGFFEVTVDQAGLFNIRANMADLTDLIKDAAEKGRINYFFYNKPENEKTSLDVSGVTFETFLTNAFTGKKYTYKKEGAYYIIGEHATEGLRSTQLIQLENRSIEAVLPSLPRVFSEKLEIKEFVELNGLIVSGSKTVIDELALYIKQIDKVVPLVQIEVIIVQYNKSYDIQTGIRAGLEKDRVRQTGGVLFPNVDMNLKSTSVNNLIDAFNGLGFIKLGKVTEAFYMNLQALENNSIIKIESTPKIATISGHEATLAIGETSYYFEQTNQLINTGVNNNILQSGSWKSTDANLSVSIKPFVSTDENVTLNISVEKSAFLGRAGENAPPGKATQKFESLVRVKNNEMVLLGGLDELERENSGSGTPLISRIPILKWFFSSRKKSKSSSKLHIFIKPTIVY